MATKTKRVWTDEQKAAARERMAHARAVRKHELETKQQVVENALTESKETFSAVSGVAEQPEVQAVLETMTPERRAKLQQIQAQNWARNAAEDNATREALARHEAAKSGSFVEEVTRKNVEDNAALSPLALVPESVDPRPFLPTMTKMKPPFRLTASGSGMMVSELGPCRCGQAKLKWHPICL